MTIPGTPAAVAMAATKKAREEDGDEVRDDSGTVGDPVVTGHDATERDESRDSDGTPVGRADAVEDAVQSGADPEDVAGAS